MRNTMSRWARAAAMGVLLGAVCTSMAGDSPAEEIWVKRPELELREGRGGVYPTVVTVHKGDKLTVIERVDNWVKVQIGDKQGWALESSMSARKVDAGGMAGLTTADAGNMSSASAAKGLDPMAEDYSKNKNLDPKRVDRLIDLRKTIKPEEWIAFCKEGNVGPEKK